MKIVSKRGKQEQITEVDIELDLSALDDEPESTDEADIIVQQPLDYEDWTTSGFPPIHGTEHLTWHEGPPQNPERGDAYCEIMTNCLCVYNGSYWVTIPLFAAQSITIVPPPPRQDIISLSSDLREQNELF